MARDGVALCAEWPLIKGHGSANEPARITRGETHRAFVFVCVYARLVGRGDERGRLLREE